MFGYFSIVLHVILDRITKLLRSFIDDSGVLKRALSFIVIVN
ncbi:hypothetical protein [Rubritalea tangerina]